MKALDDLIVGALDLHQHLGPSVIPRRLDSVESVLEAKKAGLRAIVAKDHQYPTVAHAELAKKYFGNDSDIQILSGIAMNHEVGGLNASSLETAISMGIKFVWMPTISTENHHVQHSKGGLKFPNSKKSTPDHKAEYIRIIEESGVVTKEVKRILNIVAGNDHLVLGTGHGSAEEVDAIIEAAVQSGIKNILVNHPAYMIDATDEQMMKWADMGAFIEIGACTSDPISKFYHVDINRTIKLINFIGPERIIIDSDYGQVGNPTPVEGLKHFIGILIEKGVSPEDIEKMIKWNPSKLIGLEQ